MTINQILASNANKMQVLIKEFVSAIKNLFGILQKKLAVLISVKIATQIYIENATSVKIIAPFVNKRNFKS